MQFNIDTKGINTNTVALTDYEMVSAKVAKVIVAFTGNHSKESITEALASKMQYMATPVENSFRIVKPNVAVGFVRANTELREVNEKELKASYRVMASNILMDNQDKTLWEVREGAGGKFLARHGNEDLSELVSASVFPRSDVPRLRNLSVASVAAKEFVAFASASGDMDYGFCIASKGDRLRVVAASTGRAETIPYSVVASVIPVGGAKIPKSVHERITASGVSREDKSQMVEYYSRLYSYAPDYLREVISQIEETAAL